MSYNISTRDKQRVKNAIDRAYLGVRSDVTEIEGFEQLDVYRGNQHTVVNNDTSLKVPDDDHILEQVSNFLSDYAQNSDFVAAYEEHQLSEDYSIIEVYAVFEESPEDELVNLADELDPVQ